jgi:signal transduction histidine kinase
VRDRREVPRLTTSRLVLLAGALLTIPAIVVIEHLWPGRNLHPLSIAVGAALLSVLVVARFAGLVRAVEGARVAERAANEQLRELDRLKDEFVATVSHELRTPLTSMMGFLEMLREGEAGELSPEQARFLGIVYRSSERLQRLVGDLLFIARLDASGLQLHLEDGVHLENVVAEVVESAAADARSHEVDLRLERDGDVEVRGDRERLGQLVANLISNAVKFTPAGGNVTARVFADDGNGVVEIEDTGIGIPKAEQERLFQRFFRASTATDQAIPGTGLGLAITKAIAEAHHGRISCRSEPGHGTCFRIEIPFRLPE